MLRIIGSSPEKSMGSGNRDSTVVLALQISVIIISYPTKANGVIVLFNSSTDCSVRFKRSDGMKKLQNFFAGCSFFELNEMSGKQARQSFLPKYSSHNHLQSCLLSGKLRQTTEGLREDPK